VTLTRTHTKTYALMDPWAETVPWDCLVATHTHNPMVNDPCAVEDCREPLLAGEVCYAVVEFKRDPETGRERWVCWRHVRPDEGPIR
jgi:hypothetical protein